MADIHNDVFDAALAEVATATELEVYDGSTLIKDAITLDASNYGSAGDNPASSCGGRRIQCLVSDGSDMQNISTLAAGGSIDNVRLKDASGTVLIKASVSSTNVGASDAINMGTFYVVFKDPA